LVDVLIGSLLRAELKSVFGAQAGLVLEPRLTEGCRDRQCVVEISAIRSPAELLRGLVGVGRSDPVSVLSRVEADDALGGGELSVRTELGEVAGRVDSVAVKLGTTVADDEVFVAANERGGAGRGRSL
jgi:hypothetical protein